VTFNYERAVGAQQQVSTW